VTLLHRLLCLGCLAAAAVPFGRAQMRTESDTSTSNSSAGGWLGREEPRAMAWQAYNAMITDDGASIPELLSLASRWQPLSPQTFYEDSRWPRLSARQEEERDAMAEVLDALIQLNASVPADTLRNLAPDFENAVAVLLARMPIEESGPLSLDFYRSPPKPDFPLQYVSAALLAFHPSPDFAGKLLADIKVQAAVFVILPGGDRFGRGFGGCCADSPETARDDWPPIGQYKLSLETSEGASIVVAGLDPIYVTRVESSPYLGDDCSMSWGVYLGPEQRRRLIAEMLGGSPEAIPWETSPQKTIEFDSPEQFNSALLAFVEEQQQMYRETAEALVDRDLLAPADVLRSLPELKLKLIDMRGEGAAPISNLADLPPRVSSMWEPY
jgi:hypothetical protein